MAKKNQGAAPKMEWLYYSWTAPKAKANDRVHATGHKGNHFNGIVRHVTTTYDRNGVAEHTYHVQPDGRQRQLQLSAYNIIVVFNR